ncbi:MAG: IclR family transcriptional regulator [Pigmentiphaga sp.]
MQSLRAGLKILSEFSRANGELRVTEIANRLGMPKSQVSRMLATCREEGWVTQNRVTRGFQIGIATYAAGARFINNNPLTREALPIMRNVVDRSSFTCTLSVLDSDDPLYLLGLDGPISADFASRIGSYFPYYSTAPGKLLVAFAEESVRARLLRRELRPLTSSTMTDPGEIREALRRIREQGVAESRGERTVGIGALAVPVFDGSGRSLAALGIAYPQSLVSEARAGDLTTLLHMGASALSLRLGASSYPFGPGGSASASMPIEGLTQS